MLRRLAIDVTRGFDMNMPLIAQAAVVCETCPRTEACDIWLNGDKHDNAYRAFCPNAAVLDCLPRYDKPHPVDKVA